MVIPQPLDQSSLFQFLRSLSDQLVGAIEFSRYESWPLRLLLRVQGLQDTQLCSGKQKTFIHSRKYRRVLLRQVSHNTRPSIARRATHSIEAERLQLLQVMSRPTEIAGDLLVTLQKRTHNWRVIENAFYEVESEFSLTCGAAE